MSVERPIAEDDLQAYVDGRLGAAQVDRVETYLSAHPDLARQVAAQKAMRDDLRAAFHPYAAEPVPPELNLANLVARRRRPPAIAWTPIAACLCIFVLGGGGGWLMRGAAEAPTTGVAALAQEASNTYRVFAPDHIQPVEFRAGQQAQLVAWIADRVHRTVRIPDLAKAGYRFMGGRVVATPHGAAALYMYDDDKGTRLVVLSRPMENDAATPMTANNIGSTAGYSWVADGLGTSLVGPETVDGLHPLADEVRRQMADVI